MRDTNYAFCAARLKANERNMLSYEDLKQLLNFSSYENAVRFLKAKDYIKNQSTVSEISDYLNDELWSLVSKSVPDKKELDNLLILNDYFNIKACAKCFFSSKDADEYYIKPTTIELNKLTDSIKSFKFYSLPKPYAQCAKQAYDLALKTNNSQIADIIIDRASLKALSEYSKNKKGLASEIYAFICDISNIKIAIKCVLNNKSDDFIESSISDCVHIKRNVLVKCTKTSIDELCDYLSKTKYKDVVDIILNDTPYLDIWCDNKVISMCRKYKYKFFGADVLYAYYFAKMSEIKSVRIILAGLQNNSDKSLILKRVRSTYVL